MAIHRTAQGRSLDMAALISKNEKIGIKTIWDHVKNVLCGGNEEVFNIVKKWCSHIVAGKKMKIALFVKSTQEGTGKSTFFDFFCDKVIGSHLRFKTSDVKCLTGGFNIQLHGKIILQIEFKKKIDDIHKLFELSNKISFLVTTSNAFVKYI